MVLIFPYNNTGISYQTISTEVFGPAHTFNGNTANFYISTGHGGCSINQNAHSDADYFCSSFYGTEYKSISYQVGRYTDSGSMGYQMHKNTGCTSSGENIENTDCSGVKCKIWNTSIQHNGLYNIICSKHLGMLIDFW